MRFFTLILLLCQPFTAFYQTAAHNLSGTVTDPVGAVVPGSRVLIVRSGIAVKPRVVETTSDQEGKFLFRSLPAGEYHLSVKAAGFPTITERHVLVSRDKSVEITVEVGLGCDKLSDTGGIVADQDRARVFRLAFTDTVLSGSGLLSPEQRTTQNLVVSTKNIKPEWLKEIKGLKFLTENQIQEKANREGDFLYISFPYVKTTGSCIALEVANTWAVGRKSTSVYLSGGGNRYEFRKEAGNWTMLPIYSWVS